jgi:spore maturation protein CgeB
MLPAKTFVTRLASTLMERLAARRGQTLIAEWRKADHTLIKPGMRVKVMYQDHEEVRELFGRVINKQASIQKLGYGMVVTDHLSTCTLHVFFNPPNTEPL